MDLLERKFKLLEHLMQLRLAVIAEIDCLKQEMICRTGPHLGVEPRPVSWMKNKLEARTRQIFLETSEVFVQSRELEQNSQGVPEMIFRNLSPNKEPDVVQQIETIINKKLSGLEQADTATAISKENVENQLLRQMGWRGYVTGLGKHGQGSTEPISNTGVAKRKAGLAVNDPSTKSPAKKRIKRAKKQRNEENKNLGKGKKGKQSSGKTRQKTNKKGKENSIQSFKEAKKCCDRKKKVKTKDPQNKKKNVKNVPTEMQIINMVGNNSKKKGREKGVKQKDAETIKQSKGSSEITHETQGACLGDVVLPYQEYPKLTFGSGNDTEHCKEEMKEEGGKSEQARTKVLGMNRRRMKAKQKALENLIYSAYYNVQCKARKARWRNSKGHLN